MPPELSMRASCAIEFARMSRKSPHPQGITAWGQEHPIKRTPCCERMCMSTVLWSTRLQCILPGYTSYELTPARAANGSKGMHVNLDRNGPQMAIASAQLCASEPPLGGCLRAGARDIPTSHANAQMCEKLGFPPPKNLHTKP